MPDVNNMPDAKDMTCAIKHALRGVPGISGACREGDPWGRRASR